MPFSHPLWSVGSVTFVAVICAFITARTEAIGCFSCTSVNHSNPACEDPFNHTFTDIVLEQSEYYQKECMTGRKGRNGLFPSSVCVKIKGKYWSDGVPIVIRTCSVDSASLTMDTEITRIPHACGVFDFVADATISNPEQDVKRRVRGCIDVCSSSDGCNGAIGIAANRIGFFVVAVFVSWSVH